MSHACVLVAVDVVNPADRTEVEAAVQFQMEPYDENGEFFADGSRWDWYQIGGRWTGHLSDYNPRTDPANMEVCPICGGTGIRPGGLEDLGQVWFDNCKGCNGKGKRLSWSFKPFDGDVLPVKALAGKPVEPAHAFLRNRHWHEAERMGWFGCPTATECERKHPDDPEATKGKCVTTGNEDAKIVVWNEPREAWREAFNHRFIEPLKPEVVLVVVDYHV